MGERAGCFVFDLYDELLSKTVSICKARGVGRTLQDRKAEGIAQRSSKVVRLQ
jgi:hypothetical protein